MKNIPIISTAGRILSARPLLQDAGFALLAGFIGISLPVTTSRAQPAPKARAQEVTANAQQTAGLKPPGGERESAAAAKVRDELQVIQHQARLKTRREAEVQAEATAAKTNAAIAQEVARRRAHREQLEAQQAAADQASEAAALAKAGPEPGGKPVLSEEKYAGQEKIRNGAP